MMVLVVKVVSLLLSVACFGQTITPNATTFDKCFFSLLGLALMLFTLW